MPRKSLQEVLDEQWVRIEDEFNKPLVRQPTLEKTVEGQDTAAFNLITKETKVSESYVAKLQALGMSSEDAVRGLLQHEMGHYMFFPRELADQLALCAYAENRFGLKGRSIYILYSEVVDDMTSIMHGLGDRILEERKACIKLCEQQEKGSGRLWELFTAVYDLKFGNATKVPEGLESFADKLVKIDYFDESPGGRRISLVEFGAAIKDLVPMPKIVVVTKDGKGKYVVVGVIDGDSLDPSKAPAEEIDKALGQIIAKYGKSEYKEIKDWLKKYRPDWKDPLEGMKIKRPKIAGLEGSTLEYNDDEIPFYKRWASTFPLYIVKRPLIKEESSLYKAGLKEFEIGDPISRADIYASKGVIGVPGISKTRLVEAGTSLSKKKLTPDLSCWLDSSGSMEHSKRKAVQVLCAYVLGINYHRNGSIVGGANFSADLAYLPPSRDIEAFFSLMTAYWGGGTVLNIEKLKEWIKQNENLKGLQVTSEEDYNKIALLLPHEQRKQFEEKNLEVRYDKAADRKLERLDCVIITDGALANVEETLAFMKSMAECTRVYAMLTDEQGYKEWVEHEDRDENIYVYKAFKPQDLIGLTIGLASSLHETARMISREA